MSQQQSRSARHQVFSPRIYSDPNLGSFVYLITPGASLRSKRNFVAHALSVSPLRATASGIDCELPERVCAARSKTSDPTKQRLFCLICL